MILGYGAQFSIIMSKFATPGSRIGSMLRTEHSVEKSFLLSQGLLDVFELAVYGTV